MAAEAASTSTAHGRATLVRHTAAWLVHHSPKEERPHWKVAQKAVEYALLAECRSLADHCQKRSTSLTEKRVGLEIADGREDVEAGDSLLWVPTGTMVTGALTKHIHKGMNSFEVCREGMMRLKFEREDGAIAQKSLKKAAH